MIVSLEIKLVSQKFSTRSLLDPTGMTFKIKSVRFLEFSNFGIHEIYDYFCTSFTLCTVQTLNDS